ncbi:MAG: ribokinase [Chloroflexi bacterium]|nr:ribokinase [Chloroflexota bacterium]
MSEIVVLGSINMDLVVRAERMPRPGETLRGDHFITVPGGKGANQAAAAARQGANVQLIGRVGADSFGPVLLDNLRAQGVGVEHVRSDPEAASGVAMIILDARGENSIVIAPGANGRITVDDVRAARPLLAAARYLLLQLEVPLPAVRAAIDYAVEAGVPVILNAAPALPVDAEFLRGVHTLVVNESEAETLTGRLVADLQAARAAGRTLLHWGIPVVILTLGAQGALLVTADCETHVPARPVTVVDTTAAGDAFVGGLAAALLQGYDLPQAVEWANCAGGLATTVLGAQTSLPSAAQVQALFAQGRP